MTQKFYSIQHRNAREFNKEVNELLKAGWEKINVNYYTCNQENSMYVGMFTRTDLEIIPTKQLVQELKGRKEIKWFISDNSNPLKVANELKMHPDRVVLITPRDSSS